MGLETSCRCSIDGHAQMVAALLESGELILRGEERRRIALSAIKKARVEEGQLVFLAGTDTISLELGAATAEKWLKKITTPPASLASKLGIKEGVKVYAVRFHPAAEIDATLTGYEVEDLGKADMVCAVVTEPRELTDLLSRLSGNTLLPVWTVYPKGKTSTLSETMVRTAMRGAGYVDTKVTAVSERFTAMRYNSSRK